MLVLVGVGVPVLRGTAPDGADGDGKEAEQAAYEMLRVEPI
ncbi:MAG: hypothetical protein V4484_24080 [Pseudomonadota bacterium]